MLQNNHQRARTLSLPEAKLLVGGLSETTKMPCYSYNLPADRCGVGSKLRKVKGSTCSTCYALKGRYVFGRVKKAMERRLEAIRDPLWVEAMILLITNLATRSHGQRYDVFRWHDSGDVQDDGHLLKIVEVCRRTPDVRHWLPTREVHIVQNYINKHGNFPPNLVVRVSAPMIGGTMIGVPQLPVATVNRPGVVEDCKAYERGGICGSCRVCWSTASVNYPLH